LTVTALPAINSSTCRARLSQILIEIMAGTDPRHNKFIIASAPLAPGRERLYV